MWCFPVTIPAFPFGKMSRVNSTWFLSHQMNQRIFMASNAIILDNILSVLPDVNYLGFITQGKNSCMSQAIFCFKKVFAKNIIMRYMTIVTICVFTVGTMIPCSILRGHYMAVYTSFRFIRNIRPGFRDTEGK